MKLFAPDFCSSTAGIAMTVFLASMAHAQTGPAQPGLSVSDVKAALDPLTHAISYIVVIPIVVWNYLLANPAAATLLAAAVAFTAAILGIRNQRATTRLRETFANMNEDNWDQDVIKARNTFAKLKEKLKDHPHNIAVYAFKLENEPDQDKVKEHDEIRAHLRLIVNDYENMALGVRMNILDEEYLFRLIRTDFLTDWRELSPLIRASRDKAKSEALYIEFEGMQHAWEQNRSYRTGRIIKPAEKKLSFR